MTADARGSSSEVHEGVIETAPAPVVSEHDTLKYHLLGPSLTKAGQDSVDQQKVVANEPHGQRENGVLMTMLGIRDNIQCLQRLQVFQQRGIQRQEPHTEDREDTSPQTAT